MLARYSEFLWRLLVPLGAWGVFLIAAMDNLHQQPCDHCVGDRDFINIASLQLGKEIRYVHCKLLVNSFRLGIGNEFLKTWIIADRIPDRIELKQGGPLL
jgi:hypothetical protein